jgi:uncharacterized protein (DUF983 family)
MESGRTLIARAIARQCPLCGRGAIFRSHFHMNRDCSNCHSVFWKDPGESLGAMYLDYAVATGAFLVGWAILSFGTNFSDFTQMVILSVIAVAAVFVFFPYTRSAWTVLIYLSGGIERPRMRAIRGGKGS